MPQARGGPPRGWRPEWAWLSKNTQLATHYDLRIFQEYLSKKAQSPDLETMDKGALCHVLCLSYAFYGEAHSKSGQLYSMSLLIIIHSSLNHYLNESPYCRTLDLTNDSKLCSTNLTGCGHVQARGTGCPARGAEAIHHKGRPGQALNLQRLQHQHVLQAAQQGLVRDVHVLLHVRP